MSWVRPGDASWTPSGRPRVVAEQTLRVYRAAVRGGGLMCGIAGIHDGATGGAADVAVVQAMLGDDRTAAPMIRPSRRWSGRIGRCAA